ncbi:MAG TPA: hypothetical protein VGV92_09630 [Gammaproteobacteria bacterium]|nr:hypothetical protein [Gammaproteobacteria bacterium]
MEDQVLTVAQSLQKEVQDFKDHPHPKRKVRQTSLELAEFFIAVARNHSEDELLRCTHALFQAYKNNPKKLASSAFLGRLFWALLDPLLTGTKKKAVLEKIKKESDDPDKAISADARALTLAVYQTRIKTKLKPSADNNEQSILMHLFSDVITSKNKKLRKNILDALEAYFAKNPEQYGEAVMRCPKHIIGTFRALYADGVPYLDAPNLKKPTLVEPTTILGLFDDTGSIFAADMEKYGLREGAGAKYSPVGRFFATLINSRRMVTNKTDEVKAKAVLECLYLVFSYPFDKRKLKTSELIGAFINSLGELFLTGDNLISFRKTTPSILGPDKSYTPEQRTDFLAEFKTRIGDLLTQIPDEKGPLAKLINIVLNKKTDMTLRENILKALENYFIALLSDDLTLFEKIKFAPSVNACLDNSVRELFKVLPGVPESQAAAIILDPVAERNKTGVAAMIDNAKKSLSRSSLGKSTDTPEANDNNKQKRESFSFRRGKKTGDDK